MRLSWMVSIVGLAMLGVGVAGSAALARSTKQQPRHNPVIGLLEQNTPVFGLYAPGNRRYGPNGPELITPPKSPIELARETVAYKHSDFVFDGGMEDDFEGAFPAFAVYAGALRDAGPFNRKPHLHLTHPMIVKIPMIAPDPVKATDYIRRQLDLGVSGVMFVGVESAEEVRHGIAAMRFKSRGGVRPDAVGSAPAFWGMSEKEYRKKADLWPLNPKGELINWVVVESKEGLRNVREIAAVKGIGVLWPGAGTLRQVFSTTNADGQRVLDEAAWEGAIQQVLSACKEFNVPCGFPARPSDIEMRMKQGFSVFVMGWGEPGFEAVEIGRKAGGRG